MSVSGNCLLLLVVGCRLSRADYVACRLSLSVVVIGSRLSFSWLLIACVVVDQFFSIVGKKFEFKYSKELRGLSPNFHIHVSVSDLYNPTFGLLSCNRIGRPIRGIYKSHTET